MKQTQTPDLILLNIGYANHHADWNYKNINSPFARIYLVKKGVAKLHLPNNKIQELTSGHLYLVPPFMQHSYECEGHFALYYIHIYENQSSSQRILEDYLYPIEIVAIDIDTMLIKQLFKVNPGRELKQYDPSAYDDTPHLMQSINLHSQNPSHIGLETKGIIFQLLSRFIKYSKNKYETTDNRILKVLRFIRTNIDKEITMEEMTSICCLSKDHFIRLFKNEVQTTPIQYINQKKIEKAQLMIATDNQPIKDIAFALSFENVYYFNRLFKKRTGVTPLDYRKGL